MSAAAGSGGSAAEPKGEVQEFLSKTHVSGDEVLKVVARGSEGSQFILIIPVDILAGARARRLPGEHECEAI